MPKTRAKPTGAATKPKRTTEPDATPAETAPIATAAIPDDGAADDGPEVGTGRRSRVRRSVRAFVVRALVWTAVVVGTGAGVYFGWPIVYDRYIAPIQANTTDLDTVRGRLAEILRQVDALNSGQAALIARLGTIDHQIADQARRLATLDAMGETLAASDDAARAETAREVSLLKAMELMSRARLFMYQSNFGLAEQDVEAARDLLVTLEEGTVSTEGASVVVAVERLDRVLSALPDFPVVARDDLDIAWQALLGRIPAPIPTGDASPTNAP